MLDYCQIMPPGVFTEKVEIHTDTSSGVLGSNLILYDRDGNVKIEIGYFTEEVGGTSPGGVYGIRMMNPDGGRIVTLWDSTSKFGLGGGGKDGQLLLKDKEGLLTDKEDNPSVKVLGSEAHVVIGQHRPDETFGKPGKLDLLTDVGKESIKLDGATGGVYLLNYAGKESIKLDGDTGGVYLRDAGGQESIKLDGATGDVVIFDSGHKHSFSLHTDVDAEHYAGMWLGANVGERAGKPGKMWLRDASGKDSIALDGATGDILLNNADCAEEFDIAESVEVQPGTVMVLNDNGNLEPSCQPYDKKVAGVISGAGGYKPGIVLDKKQKKEQEMQQEMLSIPTSKRLPVALMGKVYCKVDATILPVEVGDLLTTSSTEGHAMKANDPIKAFGTVIGKALKPIREGKGMIPVLVALQ